MTWQDLVAIEPDLADLEREARAQAELARAKRRLLRYAHLLPPAVVAWAERTCANALWYGPLGLRAQLQRLVGYGAERPELRSSEAYDVAYAYLYGLLPDCRGCACP